MIDLAIRAKLPLIGVTTDDLLNYKAILQSIAQKKTEPLPVQGSLTVNDGVLYTAEDVAQATTANYTKLNKAGASCVILNPSKESPLVFNAGVLPTPEPFLRDYLKDMVKPENVATVISALKGLSLKSAGEVVQITMARTGSVAPSAIRATRQMIGGPTPGLEPMDTDYDFYLIQAELQEWIDVNKKYFLDPKTPQRLVPRGLMLAGTPGVGKSMASLVISRQWGVPLYRLDIAATLDRYLGVSEGRVARILSEVEREAPCVLLIDESEKLFANSGSEGTMTRMLSQLLWWLQYHRARVATIMTTNKLESIPPELYRPGRVDRVINVQPLPATAAKSFADKVYESVLQKTPPVPHSTQIRDIIEGKEKAHFSHAEVRELVYELIKKQNWLDPTE